MKRKATVLSIVIIVGLLLAITPNHAKAATMPSVLWADSVLAIVSIVDFGYLGPDQWELIAVVDWPTPSNVGLGMRFYYPAYQAYGMTVLADGYWTAFGYYGTWVGNGSSAYGRNYYGSSWDRYLWTSPSAVLQPSEDVLPEHE